jgi:hypothetical protein
VLGDCDGPTDAFLRDLVGRAGDGLRRILRIVAASPRAIYSAGCTSTVPPAANYINWLGRTVKQIREEDALHQAETFLGDSRNAMAGRRRRIPSAVAGIRRGGATGWASPERG